MLKKKEKIVVRNDHQELEDDYEEVQVDSAAATAPSASSRVSIKDLMTSPIGAAAFLGGFFVAFWLLNQLLFSQ